jgi:hypothetical protein
VETKTGQLTSGQARNALDAHYEAENQIMNHVKSMSLAGKQKLAAKMPDHVAAAESEC